MLEHTHGREGERREKEGLVTANKRQSPWKELTNSHSGEHSLGFARMGNV